MLDPKFAAAYIDNGIRHRILGVRVKPFCLWHLLLLQTIDSPFQKCGDVNRFDLRTAVGICRLGYRESRVRRPIWPILTRKQLGRGVMQFWDYLGDYLSKPEYGIIPFGSSGGRSQRAPTPPPEIVATAYDAAHGARVSIKEAWEMPIGEAYISQAMYFKQQGVQVDFMDQETRLFQSELIKAGIK